MKSADAGLPGLCICVLLSACGGGGEGGNTPPATTNRTPTANAGSDQQAFRNAVVTLVGTNSVDPDGDALSYRWSQTSGPAETLSSVTSTSPVFTSGPEVGTLTFQLIVNDGRVDSVADTVSITISNRPPTVVAGLAPLSPRTTDDLVFNATASDPDQDPVALRYEWRRNGSIVAGVSGSSFPATQTTKGDVIAARAIASDGLDSTESSASTTIVDTPPVLSVVGAPAAATYGSTVSFQLQATDADADPIPGFVLAHGPAGMTVNASGQVNWLVRGVMFDRIQDFNWGAGLAGDGISLLTGTIRVTDPGRRYPMRRVGVQIPTHAASLRVADLDGDGDQEALVASAIELYELDVLAGSYQEVWAYPYSVAAQMSLVRSVAVADLNADSRMEIFFSEGEWLIRLDGIARRETARYRIAQPEQVDPVRPWPHTCTALETADLEGDGDVEVICMVGEDNYGPESGRIVVLSAMDLGVLWSVDAPAAGQTMAIGNVDADPALEIVTSGGHVFDGNSRASEWRYVPTFGEAIALGDLDGNGVAEIVAGTQVVDADGLMKAYSAVSRSVLWTYDPDPLSTTPDHDVVRVANLQGDATPEILVGDGQWGKVNLLRYDPVAGRPEPLWSITNPGNGTSALAYGDIDDDGEVELVWGSDYESSGRDYLIVAGTAPTGSVEWISDVGPQLGDDFASAGLARIAPGVSGLSFLTSRANSNHSGTYAVLMNPGTGALTVSDEIGDVSQSPAVLDIADVDLDGRDEWLVGTGNVYTPHTAVFDFASNTAEWTTPSLGVTQAFTHSDLTGDGRPELVAATREGRVYVLNLYSQTLLWQSDVASISGRAIGPGNDVAIADLDADGTPEIVAAFDEGVVVYAKPPVGYDYQVRNAVAQNGRDLVVADTDGDTIPEVHVLGLQRLARYNGSLQLISEIELSVPTHSIHLEDAGTARKNLIVGFGGEFWSDDAQVFLMAVDPANGAEVWRSPAFNGPVGVNGLEYLDANGDGVREIAFGAQLGMYLTR